MTVQYAPTRDLLFLTDHGTVFTGVICADMLAGELRGYSPE